MKWISHIVQGILALGFLTAGLAKLFSNAEQIGKMYTEPLGYAPEFIYMIGAVETVAALALLIGYRWRTFAAGSSVVLVVIMIGAVASLLMAGAAADAALPAVYLIMLIVLLVRLIRNEAVMKLLPQRI